MFYVPNIIILIYQYINIGIKNNKTKTIIVINH